MEKYKDLLSFDDDISSEEEANAIFGAIGLQDLAFKDILWEFYVRDAYSAAVAVHAENNSNEEKKVLFFSFFDGYLWDHICDFEFRTGKSFDLKIFLAHSPMDDVLDVLKSAVKISNDFGPPAYLVKDSCDGLELLQGPANFSRTGIQTCPRERDYQAAEFWVLFHDVGSIAHSARVVKPDQWFESWYAQKCGKFTLKSMWTDDGICLDINANAPRDEKEVLEFLIAKKHALENELKECEIEYSSGKIDIRIYRMPAVMFSALRWEEKTDIASLLHTAESIVSCALWDFQETRKA